METLEGKNEKVDDLRIYSAYVFRYLYKIVQVKVGIPIDGQKNDFCVCENFLRNERIKRSIK